MPTPAKFDETWAAIKPPARVLATPRVTSESGRQVHLEVKDTSGRFFADVLPSVESNGFVVHVPLLASMDVAGEKWETSATREVFDGDTLVLGSPVTIQNPGPAKIRMIFVAPIVVDAAGNRLHTNDYLLIIEKQGQAVSPKQ